MSDTWNDATPEETPPAEGTIPPQDVPDEALLPDSQGEDPLAAEIGENGQGDVLPEDEPGSGGDSPDDLRVSDLP
ncbi:hypothetical protein [Microbacterium sp. 18062]|uniref:hypothetical protein n=1 Tax=Microbacterium sp. 18062 TaxID=2681410 RepID=UPI00135C8632|nr:hypothetical protein [Microbacterium sp. 18062]